MTWGIRASSHHTSDWPLTWLPNCYLFPAPRQPGSREPKQTELEQHSCVASLIVEPICPRYPSPDDPV
jgi:hypothetical protein